MPKVRQRGSADTRVAELKQMAGSEFAMEVARDFILLAKPERANAVRVLSALNDTINRESNGAVAA